MRGDGDPGPNGRRVALLVAALLALTGIAALSPALIADEVLSPSDYVQFVPPFAATKPATLARPSNVALNDLTFLFEPHLLAARRQLRAGRLPLWSPYIGAGRPLGAEQGAPLYPLNWPAYVLPFWRSLAVIALLKIVLAGLGLAALLRWLGARAAAAALGAIAYALGTLFIIFLGHGQANVFALLPWLLLFAGRVAAGGGGRDALLLGLAGGLTLFGGHPESALVASVGAAAFFAFRLERSRARRAGGLLLGAVGVAVLVGGLMWLPFLELLGQGFHYTRAGGSDSLDNLLVGLGFPELWGRPDKLVFNHQTFADPSSLFVGRPYIGALPLLFAIGGLRGRRSRDQWFFVVLLVAAVLVALGGPVHALVGRLPLLDLVNLHDFIWLAVLALAVLAGLGFDRWLGATPAERRSMAILMALAAVLPAAGWLLVNPHLLNSLGEGLKQLPVLRRAESSRDAAALGAISRWLLLAGAGLGIAWIAASRRLLLAAVAVVGLTAIDLATIDRGYQPHVPQARVALPAPPSVQTASTGAGRLIGLGEAFQPNLAERYGVRDARAEDLPQIKRYSELFTTLGGGAAPGLGQTYVLGAAPRLLDAFAVQYAIDDGRGPAPAGLAVLAARPGERLMRNPSAFPAAWVAYGRRAAAGATDARRIVAAGGDLLAAPVIEGAQASLAASPVTPVAVRRVDEETVDLHLQARADGYVVLDDLYYPGWRATVDGRDAPIRPANLAFRAIPVARGEHNVRLRYRPRSAQAGLALTLLGLAIVAAGLAAPLLRRRRSARRDEPRTAPR